MAQKMSLSWMASNNDHTEFIRMRGPRGKGFAEMAINQYKPEDHMQKGDDKLRSGGSSETSK